MTRRTDWPATCSRRARGSRRPTRADRRITAAVNTAQAISVRPAGGSFPARDMIRGWLKAGADRLGRGDRAGQGIPVGTALAGGPPDRSRRAELAHRAPALGPGGEAQGIAATLTANMGAGLKHLILTLPAWRPPPHHLPPRAPTSAPPPYPRAPTRVCRVPGTRSAMGRRIIC